MSLLAFEKKRIVITGASGFIGTSLVELLQGVECEVNLVSRRHHDRLPPDIGRARLRHTCIDLTKPGAWDGILAGADYLFHLSGQTNLYFAEKHPRQDEQENIFPIQRLIESVTRYGQSDLKVVFASTVTIVGNEHENPVDENFIDNPISVYDVHKQTGERLLAEAVAEGVVRGCALRLSNVYGFGRSSRNQNRGILNMMMKRAVKGEALTIYENSNYVRDFIHISDVVEAFFMAASCSQTDNGRYFIITSEKGYHQHEAFEIISNEAQFMLGSKPPIVKIPEPDGLHPIEKRNFVGNCGLFKHTTGWRPRVSLREGIRSDLVKYASVTRGRYEES